MDDKTWLTCSEKRFASFVPTERTAHELLRDFRWPDGVSCPRCGNAKVYGTTGLNADRLQWKCAGCRKKFSVVTNTIFEGSHIPLVDWLGTARRMAGCKNGYAALEVMREMECGYQTAWFMMHRLRLAMEAELTGPIGGPGVTVEIDEAYIGAKAKNSRVRGKAKRGRGTTQQMVAAAIDRNGNVRARSVPSAEGAELKRFAEESADKESTVYTDGWRGYSGLDEHFTVHETVDHKTEFVRGDVHTNTVEGFFGLAKAALKGTYKSVRPPQIDRYMQEFAFHRSTCALSDAERFQAMLRGALRSRLYYKRPKGRRFAEATVVPNVLIADPVAAE